MNEKLNKMIYFEKRLIADRKQLLELMEESDLKDEQAAKLLSYKLESYQKELQYLERQTTMLKQELTAQEVMREQAVELKAQETKIPEAKSQIVAEPKTETAQESKAAEKEPMKETTADKTWKPNTSAYTDPEPTPTFGKKDLEKTIGKSLMGIFASVLIFISLILFATLLLPYFNDTAKMITTYVVSFAFLGVGVWKMKKDPDNRFFIALTGCGMGALYISLLLSNMYFKVLGDIPLYVLIAVWGIGIGVFAKNRSKVFHVIAELGILISMMFGCALCLDTDDGEKFLVLTIYYMISSGVLYFLHYEKEFNYNLLHHICNTISVVALMLAGIEFECEALILIIVLLSFAGALTHKQEEDGVGFGVMASVYLLIASYLVESICANDNICGAVYYFAGILLLALLEWRKMERKEGKYMVQCVVTGLMIIGLAIWYDMYSYGAVPMLVLPLMAAGFFLKNPIWQLGSLVSMFIYLFAGEPIGEVGHFLLLLLASVAGFVVLYWKKEQYSTWFKCGLYILTLLVFSTAFPALIDFLAADYVPELFWAFVVLVPFNIVMMKSIFAKNPNTNEPDCMPLYNFVNALLMIVGLIAISENYGGAYHFFFIALTLAAFLLNSKNLLEKRDNMLAGVYVGIKFTVFLLVVLNSFDSANFVMSIACLLLAIASIIIGFAGDYKSIRIYGLVLSMISIFKLIMIDISYANTLGHALSFFVSGVLCFVISLIYNFIDKKMQERA